MAQLNTADPNFARGWELNSIAAVVVGGAPLSGGQGSMIGTIAGVLIMALTSNLLNLMNVNPWVKLIVVGFIVILVVGFSVEKKQLSAQQKKLWKGLPLYAALVIGVLILYLVII
jgi:ribose transport system permease protein